MSATGTWTNSPRRSAGFTLIEILVVLLIIGIMITGLVLSVRVGGNDRDLDTERDRVLALFDYLRDQAALQNREFGMRCFAGGYEFLVYDVRSEIWQRLEGDPITRPRRLPAGINVALSIEGRPIVLPPAEPSDTELITPQIMLFSSGDLSLFELTLQRESGGAGVRFAPAQDSDGIEATALAGGAT